MDSIGEPRIALESQKKITQIMKSSRPQSQPAKLGSRWTGLHGIQRGNSSLVPNRDDRFCKPTHLNDESMFSASAERLRTNERV